MDTTEATEALQNAVDTLAECTDQLIMAIDTEATARLNRDHTRSTLARTEAAHVRRGIEGKNAAERDANLAQLLAGDRAVLAQDEQRLVDAQAALRVAEVNHQLARYRVRAAMATAAMLAATTV